jgi:hypothetical protein
MNKASNGPMLKAAGLWAKTSVKGGQYLTGRLGGLKVLIMENRDRKSDDDPSHTLFFVEAPDRRQEPQERAQERSGGSGALATASSHCWNCAFRSSRLRKERPRKKSSRT